MHSTGVKTASADLLEERGRNRAVGVGVGVGIGVGIGVTGAVPVALAAFTARLALVLPLFPPPFNFPCT